LYSFTNLKGGADYVITPLLNRDHLNGVSTTDLVLIQKHILGIKPLSSPYRMIAADVNDSKSITTLDLILIRRLILNIDERFESGLSWKFVDAKYKFVDPTNPWKNNIPEVVKVENVLRIARVDFIAIKMGDVNGSAVTSGARSEIIEYYTPPALTTYVGALSSVVQGQVFCLFPLSYNSRPSATISTSTAACNGASAQCPTFLWCTPITTTLISRC
jgi:hypothetical protein